MTSTSWLAQDSPSNTMRFVPMLAIGLTVSLAYLWWQNGQNIAFVLPNDHQKQEMLGLTKAPRIPLTPL
ncbi:hypothetical protein ACUM5Y_10415 [Marinomonas dokdonensis]|uniref:hypothetical protein n=1 Tax=Marinomonas dokdonensis TaxID=328224 RepID=UPI0040559502